LDGECQTNSDPTSQIVNNSAPPRRTLKHRESDLGHIQRRKGSPRPPGESAFSILDLIKMLASEERERKQREVDLHILKFSNASLSHNKASSVNNYYFVQPFGVRVDGCEEIEEDTEENLFKFSDL
jgi:hypothetical protein